MRQHSHGRVIRAHVATQDLLDWNFPTIEPLVLIVALNNNCSINLHPRVETPTLDIAPNRRPALMYLRLQHPAHANRARSNSDLAAERHSNLGECFQRLVGIDDHHAVVDIRANKESQSSRMQQDSRRGTPLPRLRHPGDQNATSTGSTEPQARSHGREHNDALGLPNHFRGDLLQHLLFSARLVNLLFR